MRIQTCGRLLCFRRAVHSMFYLYVYMHVMCVCVCVCVNECMYAGLKVWKVLMAAVLPPCVI